MVISVLECHVAAMCSSILAQVGAVGNAPLAVKKSGMSEMLIRVLVASSMWPIKLWGDLKVAMEFVKCTQDFLPDNLDSDGGIGPLCLFCSRAASKHSALLPSLLLVLGRALQDLGGGHL